MEAIVSNTIGSFAALAGLRVRERERERELFFNSSRFWGQCVQIKRGVEIFLFV